MSARRWVMVAGFVAAAVGDWFMAGPGRSFTFGVYAFSVAQLLWLMANVRETKFDLRVAVTVACPIAALFAWRVWPDVSAFRFGLVCGYGLLSVVALGVAAGTRRFWYATGVFLLMVSDVCIALRMVKAPYWQWGIGPLYVAALVALIVSTVRDGRERRMAEPVPAARGVSVVGLGVLAALFFVAAAWMCPESYNPFMRMLSRLGRTSLAKVDYPICHYLFTFGLLAAATAIWRALSDWGGALTVAGLLTIAAVPENVNMTGHNAGCWLAVLGGAMAVVVRARSRLDRAFAGGLIALAAGLGLSVLLHALKVIPFAPAVPTFQKLVIVSFALWVACRGWRSDATSA